MKPKNFISTKTYRNLPCVHRAWKHEGHCRFLHGYSRSYTLHFRCDELSPEGFVVDFGGLKKIKSWMEEMFDHTTLISEDDPELPLLQELHEKQLIDLRVVPNCSMEGSAHYVFKEVNRMLKKLSEDHVQRSVWCYRVEARENDKNSAIYEELT